MISLLVCSLLSRSSPLDPSGNSSELVIVLALGAAEVKDGSIFSDIHLAGTRFKLNATETTGMMFNHIPSPPRHFLCFAFGLKEHYNISLTDWTDRVAGNNPSFVVTFEDAAFYLHCLTVHTGRANNLDHFGWRCIVCHGRILTPSARSAAW